MNNEKIIKNSLITVNENLYFLSGEISAEKLALMIKNSDEIAEKLKNIYPESKSKIFLNSINGNGIFTLIPMNTIKPAYCYITKGDIN